MSSLDRRPSRPAASRRRFFGLAAAGLLALSSAGCFQPMYADSTPGGGSSLRDKLGDIEVVFADGRIGNEVRNDLIFELTGGAGNPKGAPYQLVMRVKDNTASAIIDPVSGLPEVELVSVDVNWQLFDAAADEKTRKPLTQGNAFGKASIDSGFQRFARARAIRDAQNRSARVAAETIRGQLASWFMTRSAPKS